MTFEKKSDEEKNYLNGFEKESRAGNFYNFVVKLGSIL